MAEYLTSGLPGIGGIFKQTPEDFVVEEQPLYLPSGQGDHLYLRMEKTGLSTFELVRLLARALEIPEQSIGYAGLKDSRARSIQTLSVPAASSQAVDRLNIADVVLLSADYHTNKLRLGHLSGNTFDISIRDVGPDAQDKAEDILQVLKDLGLPNRFGQQRYGLLGNTHTVGGQILRGEWQEAIASIIGSPEQIRHREWRKAAFRFRDGDCAGAAKCCPPRMRDEAQLLRNLAAGMPAENALLKLSKKRLRLYLSALQSHLFDRLVAMRLATIEQLWKGDLAYLHDRGACFLVTDPPKEQARADRFEISPSGPLYGAKVSLAEGPAGLLESALLDNEGISLEMFKIGRGLNMAGERRPLRVPLKLLAIYYEENVLRLRFTLPAGSYATVLLDEVMKPGTQIESS